MDDTALAVILNSGSRMLPPAGQDAAAADYARTAPSCHLFRCDHQRMGLLRSRRLAIAGMTAMLSLGTRLWELDGWHWGFQCESATCHSDTHSAAEGNVSRTLQVTGTYFCDRSSWRVGPDWRDKLIPQGGLISSPCVALKLLFTILSFHIVCMYFLYVGLPICSSFLHTWPVLSSLIRIYLKTLILCK